VVAKQFLKFEIRHCEEEALPDEAILQTVSEIASGNERPRNDGKLRNFSTVT
jgi:hypothetical protein